MSEQDPDIGRFEPKGGRPYEPREPFIQHEMPKMEPPPVANLRIPAPPLDKKKLSAFLYQIELIIRNIQEYSRDDQHKIATFLNKVKKDLSSGDFSKKVHQKYDELFNYYNDLLTRSGPQDAKKALGKIQELHNIL